MRSVLLYALCLLPLGCSVPWASTRPEATTLAVTFAENVPIVKAEIDGVPVRLIIGSATPTTLLRSKLNVAPTTRIGLGSRRTVSVRAETSDQLPPFADGILGIDAFRRSTVTLDYSRALLTVSSTPVETSDMYVTAFDSVPEIRVRVDGSEAVAIVDTSSPVGLTVPRSAGEKPAVSIRAGKWTVQTRQSTANVSRPRVGTAYLAHFLLIIDYAHKRSGVHRASMQ